jgi:hypothetical protein
MIKMNDEFSFKWDGIQWSLYHFILNEESGDRSKTPNITYHPHLTAILRRIVERTVGQAEGNVQELLDKLDTIGSLIQEFSEKVPKNA